MPIAMTQEQHALQASIRDWAKRANPLAVVRAMEAGEPPLARPAWAGPLAELAAVGVFAIPHEGGTVTDLAVALEQLAWALAPGPVLPTALASLLLARGQSPAGEAGEAAELLTELALARTTACAALTPGTLTGTRQPDGALRVTGETGPLPWSAGHLLAPARTDQGDVWFLIGPHPQSQPGITVTRLTPLDFSRELAAIRLDKT